MSTFDLSLAVKPSQVKASPDYAKVKDPKTGQEVKQTITNGAITINKADAPALKIDGPLGHMYTELLNKELSLESMGAIIAAVDDVTKATDAQNEANSEVGKVIVENGEPRIEREKSDEGYVFVMNADTMESQALGEISSKFIKHRLNNPNGKTGLVAISEGSPSPSLESLINCLRPLGTQIRMTYNGGLDLIKSMATPVH